MFTGSKFRRITKEMDTKHLILTSNSNTLPESVEIGYLKVDVRPYIPNPWRCFNCQRFGQGSQSCPGCKTCVSCPLKDQSSENCDTAPYYVNCEGSTLYILQHIWPGRKKRIITIKTKDILFKEAWRNFFITNTVSFVTRNNFADALM